MLRRNLVTKRVALQSVREQMGWIMFFLRCEMDTKVLTRRERKFIEYIHSGKRVHLITGL